jgi:hypothetical protein
MYDFYCKFFGGATPYVEYLATNRVTGVSASGTLTTNIPAAGSVCRPFVVRNTAANTSSCVIDVVGVACGGYAELGIAT